MVALACWWFFWFITLIGASSDNAQYLAGIALVKAIICGGAAGIWFYRATKAKAAKSLTEYSLKSRQFVPTQLERVIPSSEPPQVTSTSEPLKVTPTPGLQQDSHLPAVEQPTSPPAVEELKPQTEDDRIPPWLIIIAIILLVAVVGTYVAFVAGGPSVQKTAPNRTEDAAKQPSPSGTPPCPAGLPAGVQVVPIDDLTQIVGSEGQASHEPDERKEAWHFSFKVLNQTAVSRPDRRFDGYCITSLEFVVNIRSEDGEIWDVPGTQSLTPPYSYLSPGWFQEFEDVPLGSYKNPHNGNLFAWRITKAWGFPLNPDSAPIVKGQNDPFAAYGGHENKPPNPKSEPPAPRVTIPAGVSVGMLIQKTIPVYPPIAKAARVQGTVVLQAVISKQGTIEDLRVVSGPAMLQQAALDAVKTWQYKPYTVNNEPVEVETTVNVVFTLGG
jgi:TonB family protein